MNIQSIDLGKKEKTFTNYLIQHISDIHKKTPEQIIELIKDAKNHVSISDQYLEKVIERAEELKQNKKMLLKYVADIILKGSDLGVIKTNLILMEKLSSIYGSKDELLIRASLL